MLAKDAAASGGSRSARAPSARVIGAGPAGVLAALHLAKRGWQVPFGLLLACMRADARLPILHPAHQHTSPPRPACADRWTSLTSARPRQRAAPPAGATTSSSVSGLACHDGAIGAQHAQLVACSAGPSPCISALAAGARGLQAIQGSGAAPLSRSSRLRFLCASLPNGETSAVPLQPDSPGALCEQPWVAAAAIPEARTTNILCAKLNTSPWIHLALCVCRRADALDRLQVVRHLVAEAQRLHPDAITFHFEHAFEDADLSSRRLVLSRRPRASPAGSQPPAGDDGGELLEVGYDLLLGADGAGSRVRAAMAQQLPGVQVQPLPSPSSGANYRTFSGIPATPAFAAWGASSLRLEEPLLQVEAAEDGSWPGKAVWRITADVGRWLRSSGWLHSSARSNAAGAHESHARDRWNSRVGPPSA